MKILRYAAISIISMGLTVALYADYEEFYSGVENVGNCQPLFVYGEFLYWNAVQDNMPLAEQSFNQTIGSRINRTDSERRFHSDWSPGFRIGTVYSVPCSCIDVGLEWTHYHGRATAHAESIVASTGESNVLSVPFAGAVNASFNDVSGHWHLHYDNAQLIFGTILCEYSCFNVHPFVGLKYDRIEQNMRIDAEQLIGTPTASKIKNKTEYNAGGFVAGIDLHWALGCNLGLYGRAAAGLAYGYVSIKADDISLSGQAIRTYLLQDGDHVGRADVDFAVGVDYKYQLQLGCNCTELALFLGYEYHQYFNQNFFGHFASPGLSFGGDLVLQGLVAGAGVHF